MIDQPKQKQKPTHTTLWVALGLVIIGMITALAFVLHATYSNQTATTSEGRSEPGLEMLTCDEQVEAIQDMINQQITCVTDNDCAIENFGCSFGCYSAVAQAGTLDDINSAIAAYNNQCSTCTYRCAQPPNVKCIENTCTLTELEPKCAQDHFGDPSFCAGLKEGDIVPSCDCNTCECWEDADGILYPICTELGCITTPGYPASPPEPSQGTIQELIYDIQNDDEFTSIAADEHHLYITGVSREDESVSKHGYLLKIDQNTLAIEYEASYGGVDTGASIEFKDIVIDDEFIYVVGDTHFTNDLVGTALLAKYSKSDLQYVDHVFFRDNVPGYKFFTVAADENYLYAGGYESKPTGGDALLMKINKNDFSDYAAVTYGGQFPDYFNDVTIMDDAVYAAGYTLTDKADIARVLHAPFDGMIVKFNTDLDVVVANQYHDTSEFTYLSSLMVQGDDIYIGGRTGSIAEGTHRATIMKLDSNLQLQNSQWFPNLGSSSITDLTINSDTIISSGKFRSRTSHDGAMLITWDISDLTVSAGHSFRSPEIDSFSSLTAINNITFAVGKTNALTNDGLDLDALLIKTDLLPILIPDQPHQLLPQHVLGTTIDEYPVEAIAMQYEPQSIIPTSVDLALTPSLITTGDLIMNTSLEYPIVDLFACADYCPEPHEPYMVQAYDNVPDESTCIALGGTWEYYIGIGTTYYCSAE